MGDPLGEDGVAVQQGLPERLHIEQKEAGT